MARPMLDQAEGLRRMVGAGGMQVIPVMSGNRHAGKTTTVANLATALSAMGRDVLVIDDGSGPAGVCKSLGVEPHWCLMDVMAGRCSLDDVILSNHNQIRVLPMGERYRAMMEEKSRPPLLTDVWASRAQPVPDVVLIDLPGGKPALSQQGLCKSEIVVVMLPDRESIMSGYALMKQQARDHGINRFNVLINRLSGREGGGDIARNVIDTAAEFLGVQVNYMGYIPDDARLAQAGQLSQLVVDAYPVSASSRQFRHVAEGLLHWPNSLNSEEMSGFVQQLALGSVN